MCGGSAHIALAPALFCRRNTLRSYRYSGEAFSCSCHSFVTQSILSWPCNMEMHATRSIEEKT
jgi:hypothetical protein